MSPLYPSGATSAPPILRVRAGTPGQQRSFAFTTPFRIGRTDDCEVCIVDEHVSRKHAEVLYENGRWWVRDLRSANGMFLNGERVEAAPVSDTVILRLGILGPFVEFAVDQTAAVQAVASVPVPAKAPPSQAAPATGGAKDATHYFGDPNAAGIGDHTRMVRVAFKEVQKKQTRKYGWVIAALVLCAMGAGGYAFYLHQQTAKNRVIAQDLFYSMKALDVGIANVEKMVAGSGNVKAAEQIRDDQARRQDLEKTYNKFLASLKVYDPKMTEEERLVLRVARIFGECEAAMPPEFLAEVQNYIKKWQGSGRYLRAVRLAHEKGYTDTIAKELLAADLPPQFYYLAMQESDFDAFVSGPDTRSGIAKGMWQFIPSTAEHYGLQLGPLVDMRRPDPGDDRHHWDRETRAAAAYMKDLYSTDAQASGLLVMACYNWGERSVLPLVRSMPKNPRERNFWQLLTKYRDKIPQETYDYVFYITSAAVIGENPRLFGIDTDNPLAHLEAK